MQRAAWSNIRVNSMRVLVINSGNSSIKFHLYDMEQGMLLVSGTLERIGEGIGYSDQRGT